MTDSHGLPHALQTGLHAAVADGNARSLLAWMKNATPWLPFFIDPAFRRIDEEGKPLCGNPNPRKQVAHIAVSTGCTQQGLSQSCKNDSP